MTIKELQITPPPSQKKKNGWPESHWIEKNGQEEQGIGDWNSWCDRGRRHLLDVDDTWAQRSWMSSPAVSFVFRPELFVSNPQC